MNDVPTVYQYVILALVAFILTVFALWIYNRRETRRKHAIELMKLMNQWGLSWFGGLFEDYAVGDYSGMVAKVKEIVQAVRSDEAIVAKLGDVAKKVATYYASNDATRAQELINILQTGSVATTAAPKASTSSTS